MCGITGIVSKEPVRDWDLLTTMRDTMIHRGPDDAGLWWSEDFRVGLAHRRLSIIDLTAAGHQPMASRDRQVHIVFNGEIYNFQELRRKLESRGHRFYTHSDTEVLLQAYQTWGTDCLAHLNGMFALAIYDQPARQLFLARDRAGEKPLYYRHTSGHFTFASELKALMADPAFPHTVDLTALDHYLAWGYVPANMCILQGVQKLPAGHFLTLDLSDQRLTIQPYWCLPEAAGQQNVSAEDLERQLETLLDDSVRLRLVADVPLGVLLSGGIDSSLVTAMAARHSSRPVRTFTITFPGHGAYNEAPFAAQVAKHFGTDHTELEAQPATIELLPLLARQYDEPLADSSMLPTFLVSRLIREHCTVALGGDGGDELFGGYPQYSWLQHQKVTQALVPEAARTMLRNLVLAKMPLGARGRNYLLGAVAGVDNPLGYMRVYWEPDSRRRLLKIPVASRPTPEVYLNDLNPKSATILQKATSTDFRTYLPDDLLVKVDRASMLCSLEIRAPWLDHRLIEFAFQQVPDKLKVDWRQRKILTRSLARRVLPSALDLKRKQGFSLPLAAWFKGDFGTYVESILKDADPHLFNMPEIDELLDGQRLGRGNTQRIFALTMFELWRREYRVTV